MKPKTLSLPQFLVVMFCAVTARANIDTWALVDPNDHSQGVKDSGTPCPGGSGVDAVPNEDLHSRDLTQAYLINTDIDFANLNSTNLTNGDLHEAILSNANLSSDDPR